MELRKVFRCPVCGGANVSARAWVNPNFPPKSHQDVGWIEEPDVFCDDCGTDVRGWDDSTLLMFDDNGLIVTDDGERITLDGWCERDRVDPEGGE